MAGVTRATVRRSHRGSKILVSLGFVLALPTCGGDGLAPLERSNVVLIVIDTLRADRLGSYGYESETSPFFDTLASRSVVFEDVTTSSSHTVPAVASLMSGLHPHHHGNQFFHATRSFRKPQRRVWPQLGDSIPLLADLFREAGYETLAVVTNPWLRQEYGFARGFNAYRYLSKNAAKHYPRGPDVNRIVETLIERNRDLKFFLYVHYMDVHRPYEPPEPHRRAFTRGLNGRVVFEDYGLDPDADPEDMALASSLYDAEVRAIDDTLRELVGSVEKFGLTDSTLIVIASDHGEEFLEHGGVGHGFQLYDEVTRVPLLFSHPTLASAARHIQAPVAVVDVFPTLLELTGLPSPQALDGISLAPWILDATQGEPPPDRLLLSELGTVKALRRGDHKLIRFLGYRETEQTFDLSIDPGEQAPLAGDPLWRSVLRHDLDTVLSSPADTAPDEIQPAPTNPAFEELLRELGYAD